MPIEDDKAIMSPEKDLRDVAAQSQTLFPLEAKRQVPHGGNETLTRSCFTAKTFTFPFCLLKHWYILSPSYIITRPQYIKQHKYTDLTVCNYKKQCINNIWWNHMRLCGDFIICKDKAPKIRSSASVVLPPLPEDPHRRARLTLQRGNNPSGIVHPCHTHWQTNMSIDHTLDLKGEGVAISLAPPL